MPKKIPDGRPLTIPEPWNSAVRLHGTMTKLAKAMGTTRQTIWRWAHGKLRPSPLTRLGIRTFFKSRGLPDPYQSTRPQ